MTETTNTNDKEDATPKRIIEEKEKKKKIDLSLLFSCPVFSFIHSYVTLSHSGPSSMNRIVSQKKRKKERSLQPDLAVLSNEEKCH